MKTFPIRSVWVSVLLLLSLRAAAQYHSNNPLGALMKEDSEPVSLLASYPDTIRNAALTAAQYPQALLNMQELQGQTKQAFRDITAGLEREEQENIYNISRYPGLVEKLTRGGRKSKSELETIAAAYPEDVRPAITGSGRKNYDELKRIAGLNKSTDEAFNTLISGYPREAQAAFRTIVHNPELVDLLATNLRMTVKAGDLYKQYPVRLRQQMDSLGTEMAAKRAREAKDWKDGLEKNPQAKAEYEEATKEYAKEQGGVTGNTVTTNVVVVHHIYPYSYWYGYPPWWGYPYWYPYPHYYWHVGFYYSPYDLMWYPYPSPYFMHWYFFYYPHHYHYNHFTDYCIDHYYGHRNTPSETNREVGKWIASEKPRVSNDFFTKDKDRPDRIKELGKAEMETADYNRKNPQAPLTREEYVSRNTTEYPKLAPEIRHDNPQLPAGTTPGRTVPAPPGGTAPDRTPERPVPGGTTPPAPRPSPQPRPPYSQPRPDIHIPQPRPQPQHIPTPRPRPSMPPPAPRPSPTPRPR